MPYIQNFGIFTDRIGKIKCIVEKDRKIGDFYRSLIKVFCCVQITDFNLLFAMGFEIGLDDAALFSVDRQGERNMVKIPV